MNSAGLNMLGSYGSWAQEVYGSSPRALSFMDPRWHDAAEWRSTARREVLRLLAPPVLNSAPSGAGGAAGARVTGTCRYDGLEIEMISFELPFGPPMEALFMKPENATGPLPGVLAFHDHGGIKYYGKQKIARAGEFQSPLMQTHQEHYYGGRAWANELAKRGYGVLVHDAFPFESRKILASCLPAYTVKRMMSPPLTIEELTPEDVLPGAVITAYDVPSAGPSGESASAVKAYDAFAARHEDIIAKSLFSLGLTWPGLVFAEDTFALDYLSSRPDIDSSRMGCCGLSGGGLRTNYLAGLDGRVRCSVTAGFMTTWKDLVLNTCYTHTWMIYIPGLAGLMDFPDILSLHAPLPALVLGTDSDPLFTPAETRAAAAVIGEVYRKTGAADNFVLSIHRGPHKFDVPMQEEAFAWFDRWLG
ncbi:MAG: hypothetical protein E4H36_07755 [Spirochaetales bacterium]|nr:MAG: hypothetical protein E4H36_07755 [Spirochaetales bacterium]